jgi:F5/8 type C domain-containing protein/concanavalin A-like lectin/glucanase superfamily protein
LLVRPRIMKTLRISLGLTTALHLLTMSGCSATPDGEDAAADDAFADYDISVKASAAVSCTPLGIKAISANRNDGNLPANASDGNLNTRWSGDGVGSFITADLGAAQTICGVNVAWYQGNTRRNNYVISTSTNGSNFQTVKSGQSLGTTNDFESYTFTQTSARYVRVTVNGNTLNNWASIAELKVTGPAGTTPPSNAYDQAVLADGPVSYYAMSSTAGTEPDLVGGRSGTYKNGTPSSATLPNGDRAADFNGSNQYLTIPSNGAFSIPSTRSFTWEAWLRPDVLEFPNSSEPDGFVEWMGKCDSYSPTCEWAARMYKTTTAESRCNRLSAYVFNNGAGLGSGADWQPNCGLIKANAWLHVVGEYTTQSQPSDCQDASSFPGSINIWVNGVKWNHASHGQTGCMSQYDIKPKASSSPVNIGTVAKDSWFKGAIGKVAFYGTLLSQAQITNHYSKMTGKQPSGSCGNTCSF